MNNRISQYGDVGENQTAKKTAILLTLFKPPRKTHEFHRIVIKTILGADLDNKYIQSNLNRITGIEMYRLFKGGHVGDEWEKTRWAAIIREKDDEITDTCYLALMDIHTKHWRYLLERKVLSGSKHLQIPVYHLSARLLILFEKGVRLAMNNRRFRIAMQRWGSSYDRGDPLDSVLDCCSALEAIIGCRDEIRLRISFSIYHILKTAKHRSMTEVYQMYGIRNDFIHGSKIPEITPKQQCDFIDVVSRVLLTYMDRGKIPNKQQLDRQIIEKYSRGRG